MNEGLTPQELADRLKVSKQTLWRMRRWGTGPRWYRVARRGIRYDRGDAEAWVTERKGASE